MTITPFPKDALKVVGRDKSGFDLMMKDPVSGDVICVATVHYAALGVVTAQAYAQCFSAAFLMVHALDDILETEQPDGWGDDLDVEQANIWRRALRAYLIADGARADNPLLTETPLPTEGSGT
jgi:hypothetical protein